MSMVPITEEQKQALKTLGIDLEARVAKAMEGKAAAKLAKEDTICGCCFC